MKIVKDFFLGEDQKNYVNQLGRNEACWCGSGKKYKKCHLREDEKKERKNYSLNCGKT